MMKRRYRFCRDVLGCGVITSAFITLLNECSDLPPTHVGFMWFTWNMDNQHAMPS